MGKLFKRGDDIDSVKAGDIVEISHGVFMKIKKIRQITEETLAGTKKTNIHLKGEILSNEKERNSRINKGIR